MHGLYDPILDDSEDIYVPIGPDDLDQGSNVQEFRQVQIETKESIQQTKTDTEYSILDASKPYKPYPAGTLEDPLILNLNYKDVFPELSLDELPPETKYKLPVSEQYDPEGKRVKQKAVYDKKFIVDFEKIKKLVEHKDVKTEEVISKQDVSDKSFFEKKEILEFGRDQQLSILEEESDLRKIKQTAKQVIEESLSQAVSVANQLNNKSEFKLSKSLLDENSKALSKTQTLSHQQSNKEKVKLTKKVSFEDDYYKASDKEMSSDEASKREVRVADEIKKFETCDIQMDSTLNAEERKLLTRQDIDEAIEAGTVRQRTGMFKTGTEKIITDKIDKKTVDTVKIDIKTDIELAKQRVFNIGMQVIPRIRVSVQSSRQSTVLLKRFLLQMTKVMITLYKFIPVEKRYCFSKTSYEKKEDHEYIHKIYYHDSDFRKDKIIDGVEEIRKPKLSGAKIAQIEGLKSAELTDRMNIVISEFLRKTGKEERYDDKEIHSSQTSTSKSENRTKDDFSHDASFSETFFDERQTGDEYSSSFKDKTFDKSKRDSNKFSGGHPFQEESFHKKKIFEEMCETKTHSYEVREMKEEKRYSESKTSKYDSKMPTYETESTSRDDVSVPLTYIAIVEAHVYTNKNAIFEEQMRRMSESMNQSDVKEMGIIYYRCEVSVFYRQFREPSLPPTVVIESIEEIPSEQVFEEEKQELLQTCETAYEDTAKKLAVQKISEVIEPLLNIKEVMSVNIKQAYPAIETPLKLISEQTTVTMEKEENILQETKLVEKSLISIEKPIKSVVETSEVKEEERDVLIEMIETEERKPRPIIEPSQAIAETIEIFIEEETVGMVDIAQPIAQLPQPVKVERGIKSAAETNEIIVDEANLQILDVSKTISVTPRYTIANNLRSIAETMIANIEEPKSENRDVLKITGETVKVGVDEIVASEVFEVFPEEPVYEEVIQSETKRRQSEVFLEKSLLVLPEITLTSIEEPISEELIISKAQRKEAKVYINANVVAEVTEVSLSEKEQDTFDVVTIVPKEPGALKESSVLSVGETETILPFEPPAEPFDLSKAFNQQASISIEESKATEITITLVEEPKEKDLEVLLDLTEKYTQPFIEEKYLATAETFTILPEEPKVTFEINESLKQQAHVEVVELKTATISSVTAEEPKQENIETHTVSDKEANTNMEASILTVAENTIILAEGPHHGILEIPQIETKRPKGLIEGGLIVAETILVSPTSPETDFNLMEKINQQANIRIEESKAITTSFVQVEEPKEVKFELRQHLEKQPQTLLQDSLLLVATTVEILPEGPKDENLIILKHVEEKADIDIEELKTASVTVVSVEEPKNENVENFTYKEKESESLLEKPVRNAAETFAIVPEGPFYDRFEVPPITGDKGYVIVEEITPLTISIVIPNEPQEKTVDVPQVKGFKPKTLIEDHFLPVVETKAVIPDEPKDIFTVVSATSEQADVNIRAFKGTNIAVVYSEEPREENLKLPLIEVKQQKPILEAVHLTAAETSLLLSEESKIIFDVTQTTSQQAHIEVIEQKAAEGILVFPLESRDKDLVIHEIVQKTPKTLLESPVLIAAENSIIISEEKVKELPDTTKPVCQKATCYLEGLKLPNTIIIFSEEPKPEIIEVEKLDKKESHPILVSTIQPVAVVTVVHTSEAGKIEVIEQKAVEGSLVFTLESKDKDLVIQQIVQKTPKTLLESPVLIAAENSIIISEEKAKELPDTTKPVCQKATCYLEGLKLPNTIIIFSEEPKPEIIEVKKLDKKETHHILVSIIQPVAAVTVVHTSEAEKEFSVLSKLMSKECKLTYEAFTPVFHTTITIYEDVTDYTDEIPKVEIQAKVVIVESTATAVAKSTFVNVAIAKEEIVDVSKYIVELAEEQVEKEAASKVTKEITVDIKDIELSSASSTISSAPSSPFIQEYVFGFATGHEYRVQSPQETELHIVQPAKDLYGVERADTSYTLSFEAAYEEEKEILHMQEFGDVVRKNQFWISDVKTMETIESSDATMQLTNVSMDAEARKTSQKYVSVEDLSVGVKSRSQSFDTAADFEINLQSSENSEIKQSETSDVQAVATIDLKSEASFKTIEDVESQAKVSIKSKSGKEYSAQSVDVAYGLTIENEIVLDGQSMELDLQTSLESKTATAKSTKRRVKKGTKTMPLTTSETDIEASYDYEERMNLESRSISKKSYTDMDGSLESRSIAKGSYTAMEGNLESKSIAQGSFTAMEGSLESRSIAEGSYAAMDGSLVGSLESRSIAEGSYAAMEGSLVGSLESRSIAKGSYAAMEGSLVGSLESRSIAKGGDTAMEGRLVGSLESRSIAEGSYAKMGANLESSSVTETSFLAMEGKHETSSVSTGSYVEMDASLELRNISKSSSAAIEANIESSSISAANYLSKQTSLESKSSKSIEMDASQKISIQKGLSKITQAGTTMDSQQKLLLQMDLKGIKAQGRSGVKSPSPEEIPSPLRDEYVFRLHTPAPEETTFIPRDCSFTPESVHEDEVVIVNGMIPHIDTKIVRVLYSPPLETPPASAARKTEPVFTKPGLKGGSETPESIKGFKSGSHTPEFTKEDLLEINRKSALLASEIDKTIRSIEEYKESVGIANKIEMSEEKEEGRLNEEEEFTKSVKNEAVKLEKDVKTRKSDATKKVKCKKTELDFRKEENNKSRKSILSRFSQI